MSKLSAVLSKKVPIPGLEYSSQSYSCGLEMELEGEVTPETLRQSARRLYAALHETIDAEIQASLASRPDYQRELQTRPAPERSGRERNFSHSYGRNPRWNSPGGNSGGFSRTRQGGGFSGQGGKATQAQVKAIFAIARGNGLERRELFDLLRERYSLEAMEDLSASQASQFIGSLKECGTRE